MTKIYHPKSTFFKERKNWKLAGSGRNRPKRLRINFEHQYRNIWHFFTKKTLILIRSPILTKKYCWLTREHFRTTCYHEAFEIISNSWGRSRSATLVLSYLMSEKKYSLKDAYEFTHSKRAQTFPNEGFWKQLCEYELTLTKAEKSNFHSVPLHSLACHWDSFPIGTCSWKFREIFFIRWEEYFVVLIDDMMDGKVSEDDIREGLKTCDGNFQKTNNFLFEKHILPNLMTSSFWAWHAREHVTTVVMSYFSLKLNPTALIHVAGS